MKYFFLSIFLAVIAFFGVVYFVPSYHQRAVQMLSYSACDTPLPYKIGAIDSRFGLSRDEVLSDITNATMIWDNAYGKNLFVYSPASPLTVNFVYDDRQALDTAINQLNSQLDQSNATLQQQINDYQAQAAAFEKKLAAFKATVDQYNQEGGAPPDVYKTLIQQQKDLNAEGEALNNRAKELNLSTHDYNNNVSVLNQDIDKFNNALNQKPEEGLYDGGNDTITIYFATDHDELIHTLAHEFGHALGIQHVTDPKAIMYPYTTSTLSLTPDDTNQLSYVCREQSAVVHDINLFDAELATLIHQARQQMGNSAK